MKSLTLAQIRRFNDATIALHGGVARGDFEAAAISMLERLVPAEVSGIGILDGNTGQMSGRITPEIADSASIAASFNRLSHQHPAVGRRAPHARSISEFISRREWHRRELYAEVFRPFGMEDDLGLEVALAERVFLFVGRMRVRRNFKDEDRLLMSLASDHLRAAWQQSQALRRTPLPGAVERALGSGMVELDAASRVLGCGPFSNELLRTYLGVEVRGGYLPEEVRRWLRDRHLATSRQPFRAAGPAGYLTIRHIEDPESGRRFLLLTEEKTNDQSAELAKLNSLGLTQREREVLYWVAQGKTNSEAATLLGICAGTVKRHLENIYAALGVENRYAAIACALRCLKS